jgi:hypothetical protein
MIRFAAALFLCATGLAVADPPHADTGSLAPRSNVLTPEPWKGVPTSPLTPAELDRRIAAEWDKSGIKPSPRIGDGEFVRRVYLDLTGQLPLPADLKEFAADQDPNKRARLIDKLLASEEYARHWMRYWRDTIAGRVAADRRLLAMVPSLELWLERELAAGTGWNAMAQAMLAASGAIKVAEPSADDGVNFFLLAHNGEDQTEERAAETARVFLGMQFGCAQCHDHPFDAWKREQFHQLASYFAKVRYRVQGLGMPPNITATLASVPAGRHRMPDMEDPKKGTVMEPKFLDGSAPAGVYLTDRERRAHLADAVAGPDNFWFAAAFVNRYWAEMMGQAFCSPVDDLGPGRPVVMPEVLARLAASFKGSDYNPKELLRLVCNTEAYQRQLRPGESADAHLQFAASAPTRLKAETLWDALTTVLGPIGPQLPNRRAAYGPGLGGRANAIPEIAFLNEFRFDPSLKADEVEGSIPQALLLMNNTSIQERIRSQGSNLLARVLESNPKDADAVKALYVRVLARKPADPELDRSLKYIKKVGRRAEAFEDLLWTLVNSAEFLSRR